MKLEWDKTGEHLGETGVEKAVVYPKAADGTYPSGEAWNGVISMTDKPTGAEANPVYADNIKYLNLQSVEEYEGGIECYTYPDAFAACDGSAEVATGVTIGQQTRNEFGYTWQSKIANDTDGTKYGYKIHIVYGALASPTEKAYESINDSPELSTFSYDITTTPVDVTGYEPTAKLVIDSTKVDATKLAAIEACLYGSEEEDAHLPLPDEIISLMADTTTGA